MTGRTAEGQSFIFLFPHLRFLRFLSHFAMIPIVEIHKELDEIEQDTIRMTVPCCLCEAAYDAAFLSFNLNYVTESSLVNC